MGFIAKDSGGGTYKPVPPGTHVARCYRLIDLGTQEIQFKDETKLQHKIMIGWECFGEDEAGGPLVTEDGMPLVISKRYTVSLHKKANLRGDLESWRGRPFTDDELKGFDIANLLDKWCMLSVIHNQAGDKTYANIASIMAVPPAMRKTLPKGIHELQKFDIDQPDMELFATFHEKLQETIRAADEWVEPGEKKEPALAGDDSAPMDDLDDDIPF